VTALSDACCAQAAEGPALAAAAIATANIRVFLEAIRIPFRVKAER